MRRLLFPFFAVFFLVIFVVASCWAQPPATATAATVPPLIKVSGAISGDSGSTVGVTFALYAEQTGGAPLWLETQNVAVDDKGRYTIYLGVNHANGVPLDLFASGEARWLGIQPEGQAEQARVMLVSVPYAMTAGDAQTLGGQPLSAFVMAPTVSGAATTTTATANAASGGIVALATPQSPSLPVTTATGTTNYLAKFNNSTGDIENSMIFDTSSGAGMGSYTPGFVGIGTTAPAATLHVVSTSTAAGFVDVYSNTLNAVTFATRAARGTPASPAVVQAGDIIGGFTGRGWTGPVSGSTGGFSGGRGALIIHANETWSTTAQSTYMQFNTTALGTNYQAERMRLDNAGNLGIGTSNPGGTPPSPLPAPVTLEVNGNIKLTANSGGGLIFQDGTTQTTAAPPIGIGAGLVTTTTLSATTLGVDPTVFQKRVTGNCPSGAISQINQDGTVTCVSAGGSGGSQSGYLTAYVNTPLNTLPVSSDSYRLALDQAITVTGVAVTTGSPVTDPNCAPPLLSLVNAAGTVGRDVVLQPSNTEVDSDSESLPFSQGSVLRLAASQALYCPSSSSQAAPSYKVVVRYRPTASGDVNQCASGTTNCNGYCADTTTSVQNCGACGNVCPSAGNSIAVCLAGQCHQVCTAGATMCDGTCVNTNTDPNNCGGCLSNGGSSCYAAASNCSAGACSTCASGVACNGVCCATGQVCGKASTTSPYSTCMTSCPTGMTACNGQCVNTSTDTNNCGSCNNMCSAGMIGETCVNGQCVCPNGQQPSCAYVPYQYSPSINVCVSGTNTYACGTCGVTCSSNQICSGGNCVTCASGVICNGACCSTGEICQGTDRGPAFEFCQPATRACPLGQTYCTPTTGGVGSCTNTNTDLYNCGACNQACSGYMGNQANMACVAGQCQVCSGTIPGVSSFPKPLSCWTNLGSNYAYACTAFGPNNCGFCGNTCATGTTCLLGTDSSSRQSAGCCPPAATAYTSGVCQCPSGQTWCGNACVNTQTDSNNCGSCGTYCSGASGMYCWNGSCTSCPSGQSYCSGSCTSTQTDSNNCGACGKVCPAGQYCYSGACAAPISCASGLTACNNVCYNLSTDINHCGGCSSWCPAGTGVYCSGGTCSTCTETLCGSTCTNLQTDAKNCGTCGTACASGKVCGGGSCQTPVTCSSGQTLCGNTCANLQSDNNNCGFCGHTCSTGATCAAGSCVTCASSQTICSGACTNLQTSSVNCGACGTVCAATQVCTAGKCQCPAGTISCSGKCTAILIDWNNCGECGNACPNSTPQCITGKCSPVCASPQMACKGTCVDVTSDSNNCGSCGTVCDTTNGGYCGYGMCVQGTASSSDTPSDTEPGSEAGSGGVKANTRHGAVRR